LRLVSDVPVGCFVSGGIDSTVVAGTVARQRSRIRTFSVGYDGTLHDERRYARIVADYFGTHHEELVVSASDAAGLLERLGRVLDEPLGDMSFVPLHLLSCAARRSVTVALTGDGGDELFAGYPSMAAERWHRAFARLPGGILSGVRRTAAALPAAAAPFRDFLAAVDYGAAARNQALIGGLPPPRVATLLSREARSRLGTFDPYADVTAVLASCPTEDATARLIYRYCKQYLAGQNLVNTDRASMATGLELRAPFLDHTFVEFLGRIPSRLKLSGFRDLKGLLKRALADRLPPAIHRRGKKGFGVPFGDWFRGPLAGPLRQILAPERMRRGGLFDPGVVSRLVDEHVAGARDHDSVLWSLVAFEVWRLEYLGDGIAL
jgi:asparagine synthase (glutamine-hydrolysing)